MSKHPVVRAGLRAMLKAPGIRTVAEAGTLRQALGLVKRRRPDIVFQGADAADSFELLAGVKSEHPTVTVIVITHSESTHDLSRAIALGCSGCFSPRVTRSQLIRAIRAIARGECVLEPGLLKQLLSQVTSRRAADRAAPIEGLTAVEQQVLGLIAEGQTNRQIAQTLGYRLGTVKDYVQRIIEKLEVSDRTQAAVKAVRLGLFS